jgi:hypothetical protein
LLFGAKEVSMKNLVRTLIYDGQVSLTVANTTEMVQTGARLHRLSAASAYVFGKALSLMTFMSACLKNERGEISLSLKGDGTSGEIGVSGNKQLHIRGFIGNTNAEIINNMIVNLLENSYGKDHLEMSDEVYAAFSQAKKDNYRQIYRIPEVAKVYEESIDPMFEKLYTFLCRDYAEKGEQSVLYRNHITYIADCTRYYKRTHDYREESVYNLVTDYLASMTDDYFVDLYAYLFPESKLHVAYKGYFE